MTKRREQEVDQAARKLRAAVRDIESAHEHLLKAKTGARARMDLADIAPKVLAVAQRVEGLLAKWRAEREAKESP